MSFYGEIEKDLSEKDSKSWKVYHSYSAEERKIAELFVILDKSVNIFNYSRRNLASAKKAVLGKKRPQTELIEAIQWLTLA